MSTAKSSLAKLVDRLEKGEPLEWARKTVFIPQADGAFLRRVFRPDGTVEYEEALSPGRGLSLSARAQTGLSQSSFAELLGISVRTLHDWEQGRREPSKPAKTLLKIAAKHPETLLDIVKDL